jgi:TRAP-type C4-dicarboxylate transport system substrate-binding protein
MRKTIAYLAAALLTLAASAATAQTTIKFSTALPRFGPAGDDGLVPWMRAIEQESGGTVKFQEFWGGQLVPNPVKEYDALVNGICDMTVITTSFVGQQFPDMHLFEIPNVVRNASEAATGAWKMHEAGLLRGMDKLYAAAIFSNDAGGVHLAKAITSLDQLKGLKVRVSGPAEADIVQALGAAPVGMNITDAAESLSRGVYDGTFNGWAADRSFRMTPLIKANIDLPLGVRIFVLAINKSVFDTLPPPAQQAIERHSGLDFSLHMSLAFEADGIAERADAKKRGIIVPVDDATRQRLDASCAAMREKWVAAAPDGAKKDELLRSVLAEYRRAHPDD